MAYTTIAYWICDCCGKRKPDRSRTKAAAKVLKNKKASVRQARIAMMPKGWFSIGYYTTQYADREFQFCSLACDRKFRAEHPEVSYRIYDYHVRPEGD